METFAILGFVFGLVAFISQTFVVVLLVTVLIFKVCCDTLEATNTEMSFDELDHRIRTVRDSTNEFIFLKDMPKTDAVIVDKKEDVISTDVEVLNTNVNEEVSNTNVNEEVSNTNAKEEV